MVAFFFSSRRRHTRCLSDWSSDVCSSDLSRQVSVLGQVARPGRYPLDDTSSNLTDILALAGGGSPTGDDNVTARVTRDGKTAKVEINVPTMYRRGDLLPNLQLENGGTSFVQRAPGFSIY